MSKHALAARISQEKVVMSFRYELESQEIQLHCVISLKGESKTDMICSTQTCSSLGIMWGFLSNQLPTNSSLTVWNYRVLIYMLIELNS